MASKNKARKSRRKAWDELTERGKLRRISKSPYYSQYMAERRRIQRQTRQAISEGYIPTTEMLPPVPKKLDAGSVRRLKKVTPKYIRDRSDLIQLTGEESGTVIKTAKVKPRATKAKAIQQAQEELQKKQEKEEKDEQWREQRQRQDEANKRRLKQDQQYARQFDVGAITERKVRGVLDDHRRDFPNTVADLERMIESAEGDEGYDELWSRLSEHEDLVDTLEEIFYKAGDHISVTAFNHFREIVLNRVMSAEEMRDAQDMYEQDQMNSFDIDEEP